MTGQRVTPTGILLAPAGLPEAEWLQLRRQGIGGSDIAGLLGMDKYNAPWKLFLEKRGELDGLDLPVPDFVQRAAMWGHLHEPTIAARFAELTGLRVRRIGMIQHAEVPWMLANLDRQVHGCCDGPCVLEIKTRSYRKAHEWGESGDPGGVPDREALQSLWYLLVTGYGHVHVAVLINGNDDRYYRLDRDQALLDDLAIMGERFWSRVLSGDPPPVDGSQAVTDLVKDLWAGSPETVRILSRQDVDPLLARRKEIKEEITGLTGALGTVENSLKVMLADAEIALAPDGDKLYSWPRNGTFSAERLRQIAPELAAKYERTVIAVDKDGLAADHPDTYRACRARVLRIPRGVAA
jgi:putative phage-type endonuclease